MNSNTNSEVHISSPQEIVSTSPPSPSHLDKESQPQKLIEFESDNDEPIYERLAMCDSFPDSNETAPKIPANSNKTGVCVTSEYVVKTDLDGQRSYLRVNDGTIWYEALSSDGRTYYYNVATKQSSWHLPTNNETLARTQNALLPNSADSGGEFGSDRRQSSFDDLDSFSSDEETRMRKPHHSEDDSVEIRKDPPIHVDIPLSRKSVHDSPSIVAPMHLIELPLAQKQEGIRKFPLRRKKTRGETDAMNRLSLKPSMDSSEPVVGTGKFNWKNITKDQISAPLDNKITSAERKGSIIKTKFSENNRIVKKNWTQAFMVISGPQLFIYRDQKCSIPKPEAPHGKPEITMQVKDVVFSRANSNHTSKSNVILLRDSGAPGSEVEYLVGLSTNEECVCWETAFKYAQDWDKEKKYWLLHSNTVHAPKRVDNSVVSSLLEKLMRRPSREDLEKRGVIKTRPVFGANLVRLCEQEHSNVPSFVSRVIHAIEVRGLEFEGLYRKNVPQSRIQMLRIKVEQGQYSFNSEDWEMEALTGALKMFLRELSNEGIITQEVFKKIASTLRISDSQLPQQDKIAKVKALLESMPRPHLETCRALFHHLYRVIQEPTNRMSVEAIATVIGPNVTIASISAEYQMQLTMQNTVTGFIIRNTIELFGDHKPAPLVMPVN